MKILLIGIVIGWLLRPSKPKKQRGGVRHVPIANYPKPPHPPKQPIGGD